ncbi:excreted virulence factor EspC (type VII ESX diderm) [Nocardioides aurantiacus]|uniref:Excreted virulence factor EspC (Type VII ESX diderm) n=2 Tax=Nocardioides aurantiacus TaxID=86796 RepID=A0A3N2CPA1_9ACTN|nr:excreted virulence factor EspC (type VII ESX diderm) [Nocardioides aurantiacus]
MSGFEAVAADIRSAGSEMSSAAAGAKSADPSGSVGDVATALPGSQSAAAAGKLVGAWRERFQGWHDDAEAQAERMRESAAAYDASDYRADVEQRILMHRTGGGY